MPLPKSLTTVTTFSKTLAMILFILFPFVGLYAGMQYEKKLSPQQTPSLTNSPPPTYSFPSPTNPEPNSQIVPSCRPRPACLDATPRCMIPETADMCPPKLAPTAAYACDLEAKLCPDGSYVSRTGPNCKFTPCSK